MILYRNEKQKQKNLGILRALLLDTSPKCGFFFPTQIRSSLYLGIQVRASPS